ncbi:acetoacetate decarboxylase family protein [Thioalkalivibrio sp. XN8]|uniref:acetoacetate decarboxylase family protein n=1 Tax=Thioalkalivibrio sp. XN8 TaxID=2712863 RepID=UPI0013ECB201|nr:acetoacetate decarboxylase family protein [Thioalkalivibrio sp. XN8]NGP53445.1 acetoacetate decarboxylase family protein [Thioalkalivibrio sp. XN8]
MSEWRLLTPDSELPEVPAAPAPWRLTGDGWILLLELPEAARRDPRHLPPELRDCPLGGPAIVMFVDYAESPAGPYRELLYIPGRFTLPDGAHAWSVTRIYVSTWESVANGRRNWGIPKDRADFAREQAGRGERLRVAAEGRMVAELELGARGPRLPARAGLLPASLRRLVQFHAGRRFELAPGAHGGVRLARVERLASDPGLFPALADARVRLALKAERFTLEFPVATSAAQTPR